MANRSSFIKDLATIPTLTEDNYLVLADGTLSAVTNIKSYKATMADVGAFIGEHTLVTPVIIRDQVAFTASIGTMTISGATATLSNATDHAALVVGDIIVFPANYPTTVVQAIGAFPNITVVPSINFAVGSAFFYGDATLSTLDSSDNVINTLSYGGITSIGTLLVSGPSEIGGVSYFNSLGLSIAGSAYVSDVVRCSTYTSYPSIGYSDIRDETDAYIIQRNVDDGMVTYYHRPFLNVTMTVSQPITPGVWTPVAFTVWNGTDAQNTTHQRNVVGSPSYDTTNYAFPVPYAADYPQAAYLINVAVAAEVSAKTNDLFFVSIYSGPTATGDTLILAETYHTFNFSVNARPYCFDVCRTVFLRPLANINHRWLRVKVWMTTGGGNAATILSASENTFFNVVCLG
jgi:hypothetical protein